MNQEVLSGVIKGDNESIKERKKRRRNVSNTGNKKRDTSYPVYSTLKVKIHFISRLSIT